MKGPLPPYLTGQIGLPVRPTERAATTTRNDGEINLGWKEEGGRRKDPPQKMQQLIFFEEEGGKERKVGKVEVDSNLPLPPSTISLGINLFASSFAKQVSSF